MKKTILSWAGTLMLVLFSFISQAQAPCNNSQPRPVMGEQHPCPGDIETYCIDDSRGYTSFEWDVPRAQAGDPPVGWEIISGQGTNCVTVRVGQKSGTMKVKVTDPQCGTKVGTLPVKPGKDFRVNITGPGLVCVGKPQMYMASIKKVNRNGNTNNGNGNAPGEFTYRWSVPADWKIQSGQGTDEIMVIPGSMDGEVNLFVDDNPKVSGNGNNGNGVGGYKEGYCGQASDGMAVQTTSDCGGGACVAPAVALTGPSEVCNLDEENATTLRVEPVAGVSYEFEVPEGLLVIDEGNGFITFVAFVEENQLGQPLTVTLTSSNECGTDVDRLTLRVTECSLGNPLPVELTRFEGASRGGWVELSWATASEQGNDRFEVERSADGRAFAPVGRVRGSGNSSAPVEYAFTDRTAPAGTSYYRLRQVDQDGGHEYSKVIAVRHSAAAGGQGRMAVHPNPVTQGRAVVTLAAPLAGRAALRLSDMAGRVLLSTELRGEGAEFPLDLRGLNLRAGVYLLTVTSGGQIATQRIMVR